MNKISLFIFGMVWLAIAASVFLGIAFDKLSGLTLFDGALAWAIGMIHLVLSKHE